VSAEQQLTLLDARTQRDDAMTRVDVHADADWKIGAWAFLCEYLRTHRTMCSDDLWDAGLPSTRENRALGPLIMRAARAGMIVKDGYRPSTRRHLTPLVVWRSLTCEDGAR
jgi:hypothetical protein